MKRNLVWLCVVLLLGGLASTVKATSPYLVTGNQFLAEGNWRQAIEEFEQGLASGGYDLDLADGLFRAYLQSNTTVSDYIEQYKTITKDDYLNPLNHYILGRLRLHKARNENPQQYLSYYQVAVESLATAAAFGLEEARTYYYLGLAYERDLTWGNYDRPNNSRIGSYENAIVNHERSIELDSTLVDPYVRLALIYTVTGNMERSLKVMEKAMSANPDQPEAIYWYAHFSYLAKNYDDAVSYALHVTQLDPEYARAYGLLGLAYAKLGQKNIAIAMLRQGFNLGLGDQWSYYRFNYRDTWNSLTK